MRLFAPHLRRPPGELPAGWQQWLDAAGQRPGRVSGAPADEITAVLVRREPAVPPRASRDLGRWQAFRSLWLQQWHSAEPDDRGTRIFAGATTFVWHVAIGALLLWLMYLDLISVAHPPAKGEETVIQVEYIGRGTPEEVGGGEAEPTEDPTDAPVAPAAAPDAVVGAPASPETTAEPLEPAAPAMPTIQIATEMPIVPTTAPEVVERDIPQPPAVEQPLVVSEPVPDSSETFVLPATTPRSVNRAIEMPEIAAAAPEVQEMEVATVPRPAARALPQPELVQPTIAATAPEVATRDIPVAPRPTARPVAQPEVSMPRLVTQAPEPRVREIAIEPGSGETTATTATAESGDQSPQQDGSRATASEATPEAPGSTTGPEPVATAGGWPSPERADDWGMSDTETPGGQQGQPPGLYNSDGSVRIARTPGSASPGQPPGTVTEEIANLDRAGTWLKRPPTDYEPTAFDQYWRPDENLLQEWVRRSITTVRIPVPGTNKHIVCQTVLLVVGGACDISDPNLNDQPATARPPPDIPFKPELQEDNGSVAPGPAG